MAKTSRAKAQHTGATTATTTAKVPTAKATPATTAQPATPPEVHRERIAAVLPLECPGDHLNALAWIGTAAGWLAQHYTEDCRALAALLPPKEWGGLDSDSLWHEREQWNRYSVAISHMSDLMPILRAAVKRNLPEAFTANFHRYCLPTAAKVDPEQATGAWRETARLAEIAIHAANTKKGKGRGGKRAGAGRHKSITPVDLRRRQREVWILRKEQNISYAAIAHRLEISECEAKKDYNAHYRHFVKTPKKK